MRALITGASSGIGKEMAYILAEKGIDLCLVARRYDRLFEIKNNIEKKYKVNVSIFKKDLSNKSDCMSLPKETGSVDILINNAGFGKLGYFSDISLDDEISLIDVNVKSLHILTKLYLENMNDGGYILNVASVASFMPAGPLLATYYASKAYVLSLSQGINEEMKKQNRKISVSALCPGPVDTEFNSVAGARFALNSLSAKKVASVAIKKMFKRKRVIVPGLVTKLSVFLTHIVPDGLMIKITHKMQKKKR